VNKFTFTLSYEEIFKINFVGLEKCYNFVVENFFIWSHFVLQNVILNNCLPSEKKHSVKKVFAERFFLSTRRQSALCWVPEKLPLHLGEEPVFDSDRYAGGTVRCGSTVALASPQTAACTCVISASRGKPWQGHAGRTRTSRVSALPCYAPCVRSALRANRSSSANSIIPFGLIWMHRKFEVLKKCLDFFISRHQHLTISKVRIQQPS
jgi:hypothetical protein